MDVALRNRREGVKDFGIDEERLQWPRPHPVGVFNKVRDLQDSPTPIFASRLIAFERECLIIALKKNLPFSFMAAKTTRHAAPALDPISVGPRRRRLIALSSVLACAGGILCAPSQASIITLDAVDSGWYYKSGTANGSQNGIYSVNRLYRDWLGFDLSGINDPIIGAVLEVKSNGKNQSGQLFNWWDVTTTYANLGTSSLAIYNDLGGGTLLASGVHTAGTLDVFALNSDGLSSLNAANSFWAIGGQNTVANAAFGYTSGVGSGDFIKLVLTLGDSQPLRTQFEGAVPVPETGSTLPLLALGVCGMIGYSGFRAMRQSAKGNS
jgi:hypothetical protein